MLLSQKMYFMFDDAENTEDFYVFVSHENC